MTYKFSPYIARPFLHINYCLLASINTQHSHICTEAESMKSEEGNTVNGNSGNSTHVSYLPAPAMVENYGVWSLRR